MYDFLNKCIKATTSKSMSLTISLSCSIFDTSVEVTQIQGGTNLIDGQVHNSYMFWKNIHFPNWTLIELIKTTDKDNLTTKMTNIHFVVTNDLFSKCFCSSLLFKKL